jgi:hypothetical protein
MDIILTFAVLTGLLVAVEVQRFPLSWPGWIVGKITRREPARDDDRPAPAGGPPGADGASVELGLFTWPFIRRRLDALAEELARLDRDPDVFAKAFHTQVARSAYEALLADASRLASQPRRPADQSLEFELVTPRKTLREELDV